MRARGFREKGLFFFSGGIREFPFGPKPKKNKGNPKTIKTERIEESFRRFIRYPSKKNGKMM